VCLEGFLLEHGGADVLVLRPACNALTRSFDGVEEGASRIADEIREVVAAHPTLARLSLIGNSLGGIYARYAAALLFEPAPSSSGDSGSGGRCGGTMAGLIPDTFLTTATPHLGVGPFGYLGAIPRALRTTVSVALSTRLTHSVDELR
jgi:hypothetical protein